ncbi:hypothetical protein NC652_032053 [Populus alba x Populus x berolinensis]|nr:hypothetical protein NC652_032049 [Populus alba x Populus x berolinensis]KAJ6885241.1 hypothetical protein NC652_032053 [Populus alba x Populus x berolinensis]
MTVSWHHTSIRGLPKYHVKDVLYKIKKMILRRRRMVVKNSRGSLSCEKECARRHRDLYKPQLQSNNGR